MTKNPVRCKALRLSGSRCNLVLTDPESVRQGMGRTCRERLGLCGPGRRSRTGDGEDQLELFQIGGH